ncbi:MAG: hypothetical protein R3E39_25145 [Anaerolineae bacterium]
MLKKILSILVLLSVTFSLAGAQDTTVLFQVVSSEPIVAHGSDWDSRYTDPGAVVYHDGQFHMFRNGFKDWPASVEIGYVTSDDGVSWTKVGDEPIMMTKDVSYAKIAALASSVLVRDDGTWVMYFYTWNDRNGPFAKGAIGRATAPAPSGPWTPDIAPVLEAGEKGAWDELQVAVPSVVKTDDGYVMYYTGANKAQVGQMGRATSADGITWVKDDEPVFSATGNTGDFDSLAIYQPSVVKTENGWVMLYKGISNRNYRSLPNGLALSEDGIHWTRYSDNPVLTVDIIAEGDGLWFTNLLYQDSTYYLFFELGINRQTNIYLATHKGALAN